MNEFPNLYPYKTHSTDDCGEVDIPKDIFTGPFSNAEQNCSIKISQLCLGE